MLNFSYEPRTSKGKKRILKKLYSISMQREANKANTRCKDNNFKANLLSKGQHAIFQEGGIWTYRDNKIASFSCIQHDQSTGPWHCTQSSIPASNSSICSVISNTLNLDRTSREACISTSCVFDPGPKNSKIEIIAKSSVKQIIPYE